MGMGMGMGLDELGLEAMEMAVPAMAMVTMCH